jgi:hypothetical protein
LIFTLATFIIMTIILLHHLDLDHPNSSITWTMG